MRELVLGIGCVCGLSACVTADTIFGPTMDHGGLIPDLPDAGVLPSPDASMPSPPSIEFGTFQGLVPVTMGAATRVEGAFSVTLTEAAGGTGCALIADDSGTPGTLTGLVTARLDIREESAPRCPEGIYAIRDNPGYCGRRAEPFTLPESCALYKHWSAAGEQDAAVLATGGFVSVESRWVGGDTTQCNVQASFSFGDGNIDQRAFSYTFSSEGTADTFCVQP